MTNPDIIRTLKNPRYEGPPPNNDIRLDAEYGGQSVTFLASSRDSIEKGREIHQRALAGEYGEIADYVPQPPQPNDNPNFVPAHAITDAFKKIEENFKAIWEAIDDLKARLP
jgi:hypothetical protein